MQIRKKSRRMSLNNPGMVGTYSISVKGLFENWKKINKPIEIQKKGKKTLRPILYPIFEACSNLTEDRFWQSTFMDCARGKFPRGFIFKNNLITYRKGNRNNRLEISNSPSEVFSSTMDFFSKTAGIISQADQRKMQKKEEEKLLEKMDRSEMTWKDIKTEKLKNVLICDFINDICEKVEFTKDERDELTTTIKKGFMLKYFTPNNISMLNGKISEIDGLLFNEKTNEYEIDESYITKRPGRKVCGLGVEKVDKKTAVNFLELWEKYLENLETKRIKKINSYSYSNNQNDDSDDLSTSKELSTSRDSYKKSKRIKNTTSQSESQDDSED